MSEMINTGDRVAPLDIMPNQHHSFNLRMGYTYVVEAVQGAFIKVNHGWYHFSRFSVVDPQFIWIKVGHLVEMQKPIIQTFVGRVTRVNSSRDMFEVKFTVNGETTKKWIKMIDGAAVGDESVHAIIAFDPPQKGCEVVDETKE